MQALKKGYKLSPFGLLIKNTDEDIDKNIILEKIGKDQISSIKDIFDFLNFKKS